MKFLVVASLLTLAWTFPQGLDERLTDSAKCGYESCPVPIPGKLNVHLVPHTHDDVGWLKTVDQYYFGSKTMIQNAGVQYIIDSVVTELLHDPKKKFVYVETAFFWKWWEEQEDYLKHRVKQLVKNGQLEFIGGAWSMNDEATTHYQSVIDQFTWGFRKLNDTFGKCGQPRIGWQIDPFGHSKETASMMAHFGFDGLFFGRLDYQDKINRLEKHTMEMIWEGSQTLGPNADIFTGALYNLYQAPSGFCFDIMCGDEPIIDDKRSPDYNVDRRVSQFLQFIKVQSSKYRMSDIIVTMGGDFNYQDAHYYFKNLDKLVRYVNERQKIGSNVNVFYSTPSCYVKSLHEANVTWPTKQDDFFPYASDQHSYWTGYFTSRPTLKYYERKGNNLLQICKQLGSIALLGPEDNPDIDALREAMGIMQHHDAITGTEKQHVADDYSRILTEAINKCEIVTTAGLNKILTKGSPAVPSLEMTSCPLLNISDCSISSESQNFIATVYNPLSRPVNYFVRLPISGRAYSVRNPQGEKLPTQIVHIPESLIRLPGRTATTTLELVFKAENIPPLGYRSYYISASDSTDGYEPEVEILKHTEKFTFGDGIMQINLNQTSGLLASVYIDGVEIPLLQNLEYYLGSKGNNHVPQNRSSGAYIFRPLSNRTHIINKKTNGTLHKGPLVTEVHQVFSSWASQVIRQYAGEFHAEIEWLVGPLPNINHTGKEVISRFKTNLDNDGVFYTDSNGRQTIKRKRNFRPTWNVDIKEPVAGNYYPITTDISINNKEMELTILTDRAQGGSSIRDGEIEIMLHRRLFFDDGFGVDEALNEEAFGTGLVARGRHWVIMGNLSNPNWHKQKRMLQQEKVLSSQILLTDANELTFEKWSSTYNLEHSGLTKALPPAVQILTLEPWKGKTYLLRLEHIFDNYEVKDPVTVDLKNLFSAFEIVSVRETTLGADRWMDEVSRFKWKKETNEVLDENDYIEPINTNSLQVTLKPKEIRTFVCDIKPKTVLSNEDI